MNRTIPGIEKLLAFVKMYENKGVESTGAEVVNFSGGLYNVKGSTNDPKKIPDHENIAWKKLLILYGINDHCYVTNSGAGGSHPSFSVGGHMTTEASGQVATGGTCYLMPLCFWHNSTNRDGVLFEHKETKMLELSGYNESELAVTFQLRLPSKEPYAIIYYSDNEWKLENLSKLQLMNLTTEKFKLDKKNEYVLFEREHNAKTTLHYVQEVNLSSFGK